MCNEWYTYVTIFLKIQISSSSSGTGHRNGTCLTENECHEKNGIASGGCAQG